MSLSILHASDLHFGLSRYGTDPATGLPRSHTSALRVVSHLVNVARERRVNALVLAGDQFDTGRPSADALAAMADIFAPMLRDGIALVILDGGNHELIGRPLRGESPNRVLGRMLAGHGEVIITANDRSSGIRMKSGLQIVALPWMNRSLSLSGSGDTGGSMVRDDASLVRRYVDALHATAGRADASMPIIALSHITVDAQMKHGSETELCRHQFNEPIVPTNAFDDSPVHYAALGHIHTAATVSRVCHYSGSVDRLTFADAGVPKSATLVTFDGSLTPRLEAIALPALDLQRLSTSTLGELRPGAIIELTLDPGEAAPSSETRRALAQAGAILAKTIPTPMPVPVSDAPTLREDISLSDALTQWFDLHPSHVERDVLTRAAAEVTHA